MSSVTEVKQSTGRWDLQLKEGTPREIIDNLTPFGHIAIAPGSIDVAQVGDNLLRQARYVGVFRGGKVAGEGFSLEGSGMTFWAGDEDGKGPLIVSVSASAATFATAIRAILPSAITEGTLYSVGGSATLTHTYQWETVKSALNFTTNAFSTPTVPVSWRINGDATIDAGPDSSLYNLNPTAILVKKDAVLRTGRGFDIIGISGDLQMEQAYNDYTTGVIVLGQGEGDATIAASATLPASAILYNDMHGNPVSFTRIVDEFDTESGVAAAVAASLLSRFDSPTYGATLSSDDYDVRGDFAVGDHVATFAPDIGFVDYSHEMYYEGVPINPMYLQVQGLTYPIEEGWTVGFRTMGGVWYDLSTFYVPSTGQTLIDVGDNPSGITELGFDIDRSRVIADSSVPATPVFGTFYSSNYLNVAGDTRAQILVSWSQPLNTDGSTIIDGHHYEIRYRPNVTAPYAATWGEMSGTNWGNAFTWMQPRVPPFTTTDWHVKEAPFDVTQTMINELFPSVLYEFQIRAVDGANPPNLSVWSASQAFTAARDTLPPAQPAAPIVAGSRLALQVIHYLGSSTGGNFTLDRDTQHLEVHVSGDPVFFPDASTLVGRLLVNAALLANTPVVGTFAVEETSERYVRVVAVDREGNRSNASNTATATADLIDDAHISDLTASKITAGTISTNLLVSGSIRTGEAGERTELNANGLQGYDEDGILSVNLANDPDQSGQFISFQSGGQTLAAVTSDGIGTFQSVYADHIFLGGDNVFDRLAREPARGIIAFGKDTNDIEGRGINQMRGYIELDFTAESGRAYAIHFQLDLDSTSSTAGERYIVNCLDGGTSPPSTASPQLFGTSESAVLSSGRNSTVKATGFFKCPDELAVGTHRLLLVFQGTVGTATARGADGPSLFWVSDEGPSDLYLNVSYLNDGGFASLTDGGGVSTVVPNPTPVQSYTRTYTAIWHGTYNEDLTLDPANSFIWQGDNPAGTDNENYRALIGFPEAMSTDLSGATIASATLTLHAAGWGRSSGGDAAIGWHDYVTLPDTWSSSHVAGDIQRGTGFPKVGSKAITLNSSMRNALSNPLQAKGIAVGPAPSDSDLYDGHFSSEEDTTYVPTLTVIYTR
jgi:hypothetical protein